MDETREPLSGVGQIVSIAVLLTVFNELVVWRQWMRYAGKEATVPRHTAVATLFVYIDPLVASITCPIASDLFLLTAWVSSCHAVFVLTILAVSVIVYVCTLALGYNIVTVMSQPSTHQDAHAAQPKMWENTPALSFMISVNVNIMLTWITLYLTRDPQSAVSYWEAENCWGSLLKQSAMFIFVFCLTIQAMPALFYWWLSYSVARKFNLAYESAQTPELRDNLANAGDTDDSNRRESMVSYALTMLFCILMTNLLRLSFTICSCHAYLQLASTLYYINLLVVVKFPCLGLLFWIHRRFLKQPCERILQRPCIK